MVVPSFALYLLPTSESLDSALKQVPDVQMAVKEVKEKAIRATGLLISDFGDVLKSDLVTCLPLLMEKEPTQLQSQYRVHLPNILVPFSSRYLQSLPLPSYKQRRLGVVCCPV